MYQWLSTCQGDCMKRSNLCLCGCGLVLASLLFGCDVPVADVSETATLDATGGSIALVDYDGCYVELTVPQGALNVATDITLTALGRRIASPVSAALHRGLRIEPDGLLLRVPARLYVSLAGATGQTATLSDLSVLYAVPSGTAFLPLDNQTIDMQSQFFDGALYSFGHYAAGTPTESEISAQIDLLDNQTSSGRVQPCTAAQASGCSGNDYGWPDTFETVGAVRKWAEMLSRLGNLDAAARASQAAKGFLQQNIDSFLQKQPPSDPCGSYGRALARYMEAAIRLGISFAENDPISDRFRQMVDQCAIRFSVEIDQEVRPRPEKDERSKRYGTVICYVPYWDFVSMKSRDIKGSGTLSYTYSYAFEEQYVDHKNYVEKSGTQAATCTGSLAQKEYAGGLLSIVAAVTLECKNSISVHAWGSSFGQTYDNSYTDTGTSSETFEMPLSNGFQVGYDEEYVKDIKKIFILNMPGNEPLAPDSECN